MGRSPCCDKIGEKAPWTPEEDQKLLDYIRLHGPGNWRSLPTNAGLQRCGKSCRLRWTNYLRPDIKRGRFSFEEEETIVQLHSILGNKWSAIAARLPGRTDNEIKNYWNTHILKRLYRSGIDPVTHSSLLDYLRLFSLLNVAFCSPPNFVKTQLGVHQLNPDLLRLASLFLLQQNLQCPSHDNPAIFHRLHQNIAQLLPPNKDDHRQLHPTISSLSEAMKNESPAAEGATASNPCYGLHTSSLPPLLGSFDSLDSLMSTPMSPFGSSPWLPDGSSTEDDAAGSHHGSLFKFEIPDSFAVDYFM